MSNDDIQSFVSSSDQIILKLLYIENALKWERGAK